MSLVFLDTETTGLDPNRHQVWEIAYAINDSPILSSVVFHDPTGALPIALDLNGYYNRRVGYDTERDAGVFEAGVFRALQGNTLVAANPALDAAFLKARWGEAPWKYRLLDVEAYAMPAFGWDEPKGLAKIAEELGIEAPDHSAATDVKVLRECYRKLERVYAKLRHGLPFGWDV